MQSQIQIWIDRLNSLVDGPQASMQLVEVGAAAIAPLKRYLLAEAPRGIFQPRQWAVEALAALGAKDVLFEYLARDDHVSDPVVQHGEDAVRNTAARLIARWKTDEVFQLLLSLADKRVLPGVIWGLGEFRRAEALPRLEQALEDDVARPAAEEAFAKFGVTAAGTLVSAAMRRVMNEDEEVPSSLLRRRSAAKILADTGLGNSFWPRLLPLLNESDPEVVVHAAKLAVVVGSELDKKLTVSALLSILPDAPWYVREDAAGCLDALYYLGENLVEEEIARRLARSPHQRAEDNALIILLRLRKVRVLASHADTCLN
jgi:hypothetical protein